MNKRLIWRVVAAIVLVLVGVLGSHFYPQVHAYFNPSAPNSVVYLDCPDLVQGCSFNLDGQRYRLKADQAINGVKPFVLTLDGKAQAVSASWQMQGMDMGPNQYRFIAQAAGQWQAQMALPLCTATRNDWLLKLTLDQNLVQIATVAKSQ